jgi:phosphoglycolate phosphatase-like HAD superfamily hydrolase
MVRPGGGNYETLARLHEKVVKDLPEAISDEWHRRTDWVEEWRQNVPEETLRKELLDSVNELFEQSQKFGVPVGKRVHDTAIEAVSALEKVQLDDALKAATDLKQEQNPERKLDVLGRERGSNAMSAAGEFLPAIRELLDDLEAAIENLNANRGQGEDEVKIHQSEIKQSLAQLSQNLGVLGSNIDADSD